MARASYMISARAMALGALPLAWFCAATWPVFTPPLTSGLEVDAVRPHADEAAGRQIAALPAAVFLFHSASAPTSAVSAS